MVVLHHRSDRPRSMGATSGDARRGFDGVHRSRRRGSVCDGTSGGFLASHRRRDRLCETSANSELVASNGIEIDVGFGALAFEERAIERASRHRYAKGVSLLTASAEDVFVMKAFAGRPQDWPDLESIAVRQGDAIDWALIEEELIQLCDSAEQETPLDRLAEIRRVAAEE